MVRDLELEDARLAERAHDVPSRPLRGRELAAELAVGLAFAAAALTIALTLHGATPWSAPAAVVFVLAFAAATRVEFDVGLGAADPTTLVLVPMLFALPAQLVPALVALALVLGRAPDLARGRMQPSRALTALGNAWHAVGPAVVFALLVHRPARWADAPVYLLALAAALAGDTASGLLRDRLGRGVGVGLELALLARVWLLDALLAPIGLLGALADRAAPYAALLLVPLVGVLAGLARERNARLRHALARAEAELAAARSREEALGTMSHALHTPLGTVIGLAQTLHRAGETLPPDRRAQAHATLEREAMRLRHLVRQAVDYTTLRAGRPLRSGQLTADVGAVAHEVAGLFADRATVRLDAPAGPVRAQADPARLHQAMTALLENAVRVSPPGEEIVLALREDAHRVELEIRDRGPGIPEPDRAALWEERSPAGGTDEAAGPGIGLFVTRALLASVGGEVSATFPAGGGSAFRVSLPVVAGAS